jgi:DNA-3-methyladenine glycosylase
MASGKAITTIQGVDFSDNASVVGRKLIGMVLLVDDVGGTIVETEAYDEKEAASHAFRGPTRRNAVLFGPPGYAYVYLSYGIHWCLNFVCREAGHGAGVLIRALEPTHGIAEMIERRNQDNLRLLCSGPGRLGQALGVSLALSGKRIDARPFELLAAKNKSSRVVVGTRIGLSKATERRWRYGLAGSRFLSVPFRS